MMGGATLSAHTPHRVILRSELRSVSSFHHDLLDLDEQAVGNLLEERPAGRPLKCTACR